MYPKTLYIIDSELMPVSIPNGYALTSNGLSRMFDILYWREKGTLGGGGESDVEGTCLEVL